MVSSRFKSAQADKKSAAASHRLAEKSIGCGWLKISRAEPSKPSRADTAWESVPPSFLTPTPTPPDEVIIRQRGRRRIPIIWSPDKAPMTTALYHNRTPTKQTTKMTLRSSPRKRHLLDEFGSITPEKQSDKSSPRKPSTNSPFKSFYQTSKRLRFDDKPVVQSLPNTPLSTSLKGLSHAQLLTIINGLVANQPQLEEKIRNEMPMPDIKLFEDQLNSTKKNIFKSLPTSRLVSKTDSNGFSRASIHLAAFRKLIDEHCRTLHDSQHWDALLDYCQIAWSYVNATPIWNNYAHNSIRRNCFKLLASNCLASIRYGGIYLGEKRLKEFSNRIEIMAIDCDDISQCKSFIAGLIVV